MYVYVMHMKYTYNVDAHVECVAMLLADDVVFCFLH